MTPEDIAVIAFQAIKQRGFFTEEAILFVAREAWNEAIERAARCARAIAVKHICRHDEAAAHVADEVNRAVLALKRPPASPTASAP